jgi:pimeloyl-[acyl-carrier protein] methyl ester esterase
MTILVCLHGWGANAAVWAGLRQYFADRAVEVLTPDIPEWDAAWLADYLTALPLNRAFLVGWSLGGMVLLETLPRLPQPPLGLALIATPAVFCRQPDYPWGQPAAAVRAMRRELAIHAPQVLEDFARHCLAPGEEEFTAAALAAFAPPAATATLVAGLDYLWRKDLRPLLPPRPIPAAIIHGDKDAITPLASGRFIHHRWPGAALHVLNGAGHLPLITRTEAVGRILAACLL